MNSTFLECRLNDADSVVDPELHDSTLISLELGDDVIILCFQLVSGDFIALKLSGVIDFTCNNLKKGNIVLDITISTGVETNNNLLDKLYSKPKGDTSRFDKFMSLLKGRMERKEIFVLQLNPSYGCEMLAICEAIGYRQIEGKERRQLIS